MKTIFLSALFGLAFLSGLHLLAETTNADRSVAGAVTNESRTVLVTNWVAPSANMRVVAGQIYDVMMSPKWQWVTIPQGVKVEGATGIPVGKPVRLTFRLPGPTNLSPNDHGGHPELSSADMRPSISIRNFPYDPKSFTQKKSYQGIQAGVADATITAFPLKVRVFPLNTRTNHQTSGLTKISTTEFDYGLQCTNKLPVIKKVKASP